MKTASLPVWSTGFLSRMLLPCWAGSCLGELLCTPPLWNSVPGQPICRAASTTSLKLQSGPDPSTPAFLYTCLSMVTGPPTGWTRGHFHHMTVSATQEWPLLPSPAHPPPKEAVQDPMARWALQPEWTPARFPTYDLQDSRRVIYA